MGNGFAMTESDTPSHYYDELVAAFVSGRLPALRELDGDSLIRAGIANGLRLHKFKRNSELPRVQKVLGILRGLQPANLLDIGSGPGTFLWPLLDSFPYLEVTTAEINWNRASDINCVNKGGIKRVRSVIMDATRLGFADNSFDVVSALEVMEHLCNPERAIIETIRVARRFVLLSVPSHEDDNPEHIQLFTKAKLEHMLLSAGARRVKIEYVLNHMIAIAGL
ncbi:MAG TPA: class I SAM-dependent methyltransferase [Blastocatellia bacterium]|nr:class I SAM-dependent methyltransferase [Blastocatellia bacterium]